MTHGMMKVRCRERISEWGRELVERNKEKKEKKERKIRKKEGEKERKKRKKGKREKGIREMWIWQLLPLIYDVPTAGVRRVES